MKESLSTKVNNKYGYNLLEISIHIKLYNEISFDTEVRGLNIGPQLFGKGIEYRTSNAKINMNHLNHKFLIDMKKCGNYKLRKKDRTIIDYNAYNTIWDEFGWRFDCCIINIAQYFDLIMFKIGKD